jgi:RNA polymerase sigma-70 factor (ECF subfamily)
MPVFAQTAQLYARSRAAEYSLTKEEFAEILAQVVRKHLSLEADSVEMGRFCESLRLEELALARGCAAGNEKAWEVFLTRYRSRLYEIAAGIARKESAARELADSLYAELYGLMSRDGKRVSKLAYYMGRGSLEGWLRAVLAQAWVDRHRAHRHLVSFEEQEEQGRHFASADAAPAAEVDPRLPPATDEALRTLSAEDRFVLAAYFLDGRTLAEIARMLKVHESTISRRLEKLTRKVNKRIEERLMARGLNRRAAREAMEVDVRDLPVDVGTPLAQGTPPSAFHMSGEVAAEPLAAKGDAEAGIG